MSLGRMTLGTRGSQLALKQAHLVADLLAHSNPDVRVELKTITTVGDVRVESRFQDIGTKGLFTKELDEALMDGRIDFAVHSMKDLPSSLPPGLVLACVPEAKDPRDAWVSPLHAVLSAVPKGANVGTSSVRRKALLGGLRPDLVVHEWRGNVETRINKMAGSGVQGIILASAGLMRLGMERYVAEYLDPKVFVPAPCQGLLAVVCRDADAPVRHALEKINQERAFSIARAQRIFLDRMQGGCSIPLGCYVHGEGENVEMFGYLSDFKNEIRCSVAGTYRQPQALAENLHEEMQSRGARRMLAAVKAP